MILKRWDEVNALREAFDDLLGRIRDLVEASLQKVSTTVSEKGLSSDFDVRLMTDPDALGKFIIERVDKFMELVPPIDQALQKMTRR